jgi:transcriptional regulator with XRE-family HTH domain
MTIGERLRDARNKKGLKQSDIAAVLNCAPTSLTNWENDKIEPSVDVLARLCDALEINPLDLLDKKYSFHDIVAITGKPAQERTYQETIALNFSAPILEKLMPAELQRQDAQRADETARFLQDTNLLERFGGSLDKAGIDRVKLDYDVFGDADNDILFAYHALNTMSKTAFLSMLTGLLNDKDNTQEFAPGMRDAVIHTIEALNFQSRANRHPSRVEIVNKQGGGQ